jgi:plasmid stabilization system protein ParE
VSRKVTTAPEAARGLAEARRWLCQPGAGPFGVRRWEALRAARRSLRDYPYLGGTSEEHPRHRQLVVSGYRLIYRVEPDTADSATAGDVRIVAVFGPGEA